MKVGTEYDKSVLYDPSPLNKYWGPTFQPDIQTVVLPTLYYVFVYTKVCILGVP